MKKITAALFAIVTMAGATEVFMSTAEHQSSLNLTVYNSNRALVSQTREVDLPEGTSPLRFSDVAANVMAQTVIIDAGEEVSVLEQNYEFDLISNQKILEKYVGRDVQIVRENQYTGDSETVTATLLAANGTPTLSIDGQIYLGYPGQVILPELPENLYAKPTMNWLMYADDAVKQDLTVSYLTTGIQWNADYVLNLADDEKSASLTGWVTLTNNAGVDFNDANLKLVAGDVNVVSHPETVSFYSNAAPTMARGMGAPQMQEESFFEYHLYSYPRLVTVRNRQTKQISLLSADEIATSKKYSVAMNRYYYSQNRGVTEHDVNVEIEFGTGERNDIDMPIPAGVVRLYKKSRDGSAVFIGEDRVNHTPVNEEVSLITGEAFDIVCESHQTTFEKINNRTTESGYEVEIRNHKEEDVTVEVTVPVFGEWEVKDAPEYRTISAGLIAFDVAVPAEGETKLNYIIRVKQ